MCPRFPFREAWVAAGGDGSLPGVGTLLRLRLIENAFVRSFAELLALKQARHKDWRSYINHFRGQSEYDYTNIAGILNADFRIQSLPPRSIAQADLSKEVQRYALELTEANKAHLNKSDRDKATRDAELYTSFVNFVSTSKDADPGSSCLMVSSGHRLSRIEAKFKQTGERQMVVSIASELLLVSLLPNVSLGLSAMKSFLFDEKRPRFSSDLERTLVRIVKSSRELSLPWAQRGILIREMRTRLVTTAKQEGRSKSESTNSSVEQRAFLPQNQSVTIQTLKDSLDAIAIDSRLELENRKLREQLASLEAQLARTKNERGSK